MSEDSSNPNCDSPVLNETTKSLITSSTDTVYVKSYFRRRSKSVHSNPKHSVRPHLMDPATFKQVLNTQKENLAEVKERQRCNTSILHHKHEWKTFFSNKKKRRRAKPRFVWQTKQINQDKAEMEFIKSINNLKIPMETDFICDKIQKNATKSDHEVVVNRDLVPMTETRMDVDNFDDGPDFESEPEGDDSMTISSLRESPTQLFGDSDHVDDDEGEFLFE